MRSLEQWLAYQTQVHPQAIDLGLDRLCEVLERLQWRQPRVPVITVAGTNGKGSVSAYCTSILRAAGMRVGTFTSPHLRDYRERIHIDDRRVSRQELVSAFERIESARGNVGLTFFEFNALAAMLIFDAAALDAWVLEIGMGGRLDAVNVVDPDVAIVVSVGLDHQEFLGATLDAIAREKAGVFRRGRPAIIGNPEIPDAALDSARSTGAIIKRLGVEYTLARGAVDWSYHGPRWDLQQLPPPALRGATQFANAATAIAALEELDGPLLRRLRLAVTPAAVAAGLVSVCLAARFEVITATSAAPTWILDVAHNPDAARVLAENLRGLDSTGRTLAVCGILADKDAPGIGAALHGVIDVWWCVPTEGARGRSSAELAQIIRSSGASGLAPDVQALDDLQQALAAALAAATPHDRIVVFGSFHVVGPAIDWLATHALLPPATLLEYTAAPRAT